MFLSVAPTSNRWGNSSAQGGGVGVQSLYGVEKGCREHHTIVGKKGRTGIIISLNFIMLITETSLATPREENKNRFISL